MAVNLTDQYLEALNEAMSIHAQNAVSGLGFNKTEVAEIISVTNAKQGDYIVDNGSVRYHAYIENTGYTLGTKVYVLVQNNDYSQRKLILGRVGRAEDKDIDYVSPLTQYNSSNVNIINDEINKVSPDDKLLFSISELDGVVEQLNYNNEEGCSLLANFNELKSEEDLPAAKYALIYLSRDLSSEEDYNKNYRYLGLSADFKTLLQSYAPVTGEYGLEILVQYSVPQAGNTEEREILTKRYRLGSSDMVGSIYNFKTYYNQEALFKLTDQDGLIIHRIGIFFFQEGNFLYKTTTNELKPVPWRGESELFADNIFVKNINLCLGDDKIDENVIDELTLFTNNGLFYDSAQLNDTLIEKRIEAKWLHRNPKTDELEQVKSFGQRVDITYDVECHSKVSWYEDASYNNAEYRAEIEAAQNTYDILGELLEKYSQAMPNMELWINEWQDAYSLYTLDLITSQELEDKWNELKTQFGTSVDFTNDDMINLVAQLELKKNKHYYYDEASGLILLTPTGLKTAQNTITRNNKAINKTASISDTLAGTGWKPIAESLNAEYIDYLPDRKRNQCRIKCIIEYGPYVINDDGEETEEIDTESIYYQKIISNILTLTNLTAVPDANTVDSSIGIEISYGDHSEGIYPLYDGIAGKLMAADDGIRKRTLTAELISKYTGKSYINGYETIIWKVPKINTMISLSGTLTDEPDYEYVEEEYTSSSGEIKTRTRKKAIEQLDASHQMHIIDESYGDIFSKYGISFTPDDLADYYFIMYEATNGVAARNYLRYYINDTYVKSAVNNTVYCYLIKNNELYTGSTSMFFTQKGSAGTDYTFVFSLGDVVDEDWNVIRNAESAITINDYIEDDEGNKKYLYHEIIFELYDADGVQINLTEEQKNEIINLWLPDDQNNFNQDGYYTNINNLKQTKAVNNINTTLNVLKFNTKDTVYHNGVDEGGQAIQYPLKVRVAVRLNEEITDLKDIKPIILLATVKSDATVAYHDYNYKLEDMDFVQCLPLAFRTQQDYNISGTNIIYYDDSGALITGGAIRYSLISHSVDDIIQNQPEPGGTKQKLLDIELSISSVLDSATEALGREQQIATFLKVTDRIEVDEYNCIINYQELLERIDGRLENLQNYLDKVNNRLSYLNEETTEYTKEYISYIDDTLNKLKKNSDDAVKCITSFGGVFDEENLFINKDEVSERITSKIEELGNTYQESIVAYNQAIDDYNASAQTDEDLALLKEAKVQMESAQQALEEYSESVDTYNYYIENYIQLRDIYDNANVTLQKDWLVSLKDCYIQSKDLLNAKKQALDDYKGECDDFLTLVYNYDGMFHVEPYETDLHGISRLVTEENGLRYYPTIIDKYHHTLRAPTIFIDNLSKDISLICSFWNRDTNTPGDPIYITPLLMIQNRYQIPMLNRWDGKLLIDKDNNQIMAATIAAGHKESDNSFTGVIMGDIQSNNDLVTGIYGYHKGSQSFGFKDDGTGFIGKSGTGRIKFDGQKGYIQSAGYSMTSEMDGVENEGMLIKLNDEASIDMWGKGYVYTTNDTDGTYESTFSKDRSSHVHIGTIGSESSPYFRIEVPYTNTAGSLTSIMNVDKGNYYLQSVNPNGLHIDLNNGSLTSKGSITIEGNSDSAIHMGNLHLYGDGRNESTIGGWHISSSTLYNGNLVLDSSGSLKGGENSDWHIDSNGYAYFRNVYITDGKGNTWSNGELGGGFSFHLGDIDLGNFDWGGTGGIQFDTSGMKVAGNVNAWSGKIGGWTIGSNAITSNNGNTSLNANGSLKFKDTTISGADGTITMGADLTITGHIIHFDALNLSSSLGRFNILGNGVYAYGNLELSGSKITLSKTSFTEDDVNNWKAMYEWYQNIKNSVLTSLPDHKHNASGSGTDYMNRPVSVSVSVGSVKS